MQGKVIKVGKGDDLCSILASAEPGDVVALEPGVYVIERHAVIDKDITLRSVSGCAADTIIARAGATTLLVSGGSPTIENLTFLSPTGNGVGSVDYGDDVAYQSCVATRGGSPTFIGCRASSADQSGFSVRGKGVSARLVRCEVRRAHDGGIFFDEGASGVIEECRFADNGLGCVDVEQSVDGEFVEIRNSFLARSQTASLSIHNGGRVKIVDSEVSGFFALTANVTEGILDAKNCRFNGYKAPDDDSEEGAFNPVGGMKTYDSVVTFEDCSFENLMFAIVAPFQSIPCSMTLTRCRIKNCLRSIVYDDNNLDPVCVDCDFEKEPEKMSVSDEDDDKGVEDETSSGKQSSKEDWEDEDWVEVDDELGDFENFVDEEEYEKAYELKTSLIENELGKEADSVFHSVVPWEDGGMLDGYEYPNSKYGGTFIVSKELVGPYFDGPSNMVFRSFELAMATSATRSDLSAEEMTERIRRTIKIMTIVGRYIQEVTMIERYDTFGFPDDFEDPSLAGCCFLFDAIGNMRSETTRSLEEMVDYFKVDFDALPETDNSSADEPSDDNIAEGFGLLLIVEIKPEELQTAKNEGVFNFIPAMKKAKCWPFSDLDRETISGHIENQSDKSDNDEE